MPVTLSVHDLVARAQQRVTTLSPDDVAGRRHDEGVLIVDVRDVRERKRVATNEHQRSRTPTVNAHT